MGSKEILEQALQLRPDERFILVEGLLKSLELSITHKSVTNADALAAFTTSEPVH